MSKLLCLRASVISICILLMLVCSCAYAEETVQVSIPVIATGADCSVELLDSDYHRVKWLDLEKDVPGAFTFTCNGLMRFSYQAVIVNKDTDDVAYDRTVYTIHVDTYMDGKGQMACFVTIVNPADPSQKLAAITFENVLKPTATPTPAPTATPVPTATATPAPEYKHRFTFTKVWSGGEHGDSIDWAMYNADGTKRQKLFNKEIVSDDVWYYEAYFTVSVDDCYVVEVPPEGYMVQYRNVGQYSDVTDRCHIGGTIVNSRVPQTRDDTPLALYFALILLGALAFVLLSRRRGRAARPE